MENAIRQRIKYVIEHGEVYPGRPECRRETRRLWYVVIALQVVAIVLNWLH